MNEFSSLVSSADNATELLFLDKFDYEEWSKTASVRQQELVTKQSFVGKTGQKAWVQIEDETIVLIGWDKQDNLGPLGHLPFELPEGKYRTKQKLTELQLLGWGMGAYSFDRYKPLKRLPAQIEVPDDTLKKKVEAIIQSIYLARDLINTPASDMSPSHLESEICALAEKQVASFDCWTGDQLLDQNCGAIHAVGRASNDPPRLIELKWGKKEHPKICLIGKGVTFDSGGLDLKSASGMRQMKKDMGGAAIAIGLAQLIMNQKLPVQLRLLIPAAENSISGNAFRPGDILTTRKGLTVEIDNTDAEGRLLLCDALTIADEEQPDLIMDFATLTGAARSAVGTEISAMFTHSDLIAEKLFKQGESHADPLWRLPLHESYNSMLDSKVADLVNSSSSGYAGAITAALFLNNFLSGSADWVHFDVMAYNLKTSPGKPEGGEGMAMRAVFAYLEETYGQT